MSHRHQILIAGRDPETLKEIARCLASEKDVELSHSVLVNGHHDPLAKLKNAPDVLILGLTEFSHLELEAFAKTPPELRPQLVIVGSVTDASVMRLAMQAGSRDFLPEIAKAELLPAVRRILDEKARIDSPEKIITFINAKGGSGSSFLAANYAQMNQQVHGYNTVLLDMDRQFAALPQYLDLQPPASLFDAMRVVHELDEVAVSAFIGKHSSGLSVMAPKINNFRDETEYDQEIDEAAAIQSLLGILKKRYTHIVAEVPRYLDSLGATVLQESDQIMLVLQQNVPAVRDAVRLQSLMFNQLDIPLDRITVVVNRYGDNSSTQLDDVRDALNTKRLFTIGNDFKSASEAVDMGVAISEAAPKSPITQNLSKLIDLNEGHEKGKSGGLFARSFGALLRS
jgi:pilus assembly protein CpaE